tara:strand:+ start:220 stop:837 length:618 start_codon:yes stop_codon:yes gene_type:complete
MTSTFIISEAKLREFTDINDALDTAFIKNAVREAQDIWLQRIIGTVLYQSLLTQIDAGPVWTTPAYETLVNDYIQDYLLYASYYECLEAIYIRPRNNGLLNATGGDNSQTVGRDLYNVKRQSVQNKLQYYAERLTAYIIENQNTYPELNANNFLYEQYPDYGNKYRSPFVFRYTNRGTHFDFAQKAGLRITDSRYPQFPWSSDIK